MHWAKYKFIKYTTVIYRKLTTGYTSQIKLPSHSKLGFYEFKRLIFSKNIDHLNNMYLQLAGII